MRGEADCTCDIDWDAYGFNILVTDNPDTLLNPTTEGELK